MVFDAHKSGASEYNAPTKNLDAPARNLQHFKEKHVDQPAEKMGHRTASTVFLC
jgi:hypothetical protein